MDFATSTVTATIKTAGHKSLMQAIQFLTNPLITSELLEPSSKILETIRSTLYTVMSPIHHSDLLTSSFFLSTEDCNVWATSHSVRRFRFSASPSHIPPPPVYAACLSSKISWADWWSVLPNLPTVDGSKKEWDLVLQNDKVYIEYFEPKDGSFLARVLVWSQKREQEQELARILQAILTPTVKAEVEETKEVPISKFALEKTLESARIRAFNRVDTSSSAADAQKPANISMPRLLTSLPVTEVSAFSPASSTSSSRPSSRSSFNSIFTTSDNESEASLASSTSSVASLSLDDLKATEDISPMPSTVFVPPQVQHLRPRQAGAYVPPSLRMSSSPVNKSKASYRHSSTSKQAVIDTTKKDVAKYLYHGGVSTVLTGGVMLGGITNPLSHGKARKGSLEKRNAVSSWRRT